jgi:predicted nucleotidyltransferase
MRTSPPRQLPIFRSDLQARLLAALIGVEGRELTVPELCEDLGATRASIYRELQRLVDAGILNRRRIGRNTVYGADTASPLLEPLRALVERTIGIEPELRRRLAEVGGVEAAAIFGSFAAGQTRGASDIDVLLIGEPDRDALERTVRDVERIAGREVNLTVYDRADWERRVDSGAGFATTLLSRPLVSLVGSVPGADV